MRYYKLIYSEERKKEMVCFTKDNYENEYGMSQYDLDKGRLINDWNHQFTFYYDCKDGNEPSDYLANNLGWFLISSRFKNLIEKLKIKNIQFLPVLIKEINAEITILNDYVIVNITKLTDAFDLENSKYFELTAEDSIKIISVVKYALKSNEIEGLDILRIVDHIFPIFISYRLKKEIKKNNLTGMDFLEVKTV
ncbi:MAG: hypothetical protein K0Q49_965 [Haloplasmataceae bacterium]|nr:hypothetical protein [Haloplasmataceae bacterium]